MRYYCQTLPGLELITAAEIKASLEKATVGQTGPGVVHFSYGGHPAPVLRLGTAEDVFALVARGSLDLERTGLAQAEALVAEADGFDAALNALRLVRPHKVRQVTFRVVVQRPAGRHKYVRPELGRRVARAVARRFARWKQVDEDGTLELWVLQRDTDTTIGMRLSDRSMRHRTYKRANLVASLRPVLARAMVIRSLPADNDVFVDPMCGAGTILAERGEHGRYGCLVGGDIRAEALAAARVNIGPRYRPIGFQRWDATHLPLASASATRVVCNLPFGVRIGPGENLEELYRAFLGEARRVLATGGRLVLLSGEASLLARLLHRAAGLALESTDPVLVLGRRASILGAIATG
jgi:tRNA (guanine6-N2)-methyltransferase